MGQSSGLSIPHLWFLTFLGHIWQLPHGGRSTLDSKSGSDLETDDCTHATGENGKHHEPSQGEQGRLPGRWQLALALMWSGDGPGECSQVQRG